MTKKAKGKIDTKKSKSRKVRDLKSVLGTRTKPDFKSLKNETLKGKTFIVNSVRWGEGNYGEYAICKITINQKENTWLTGATYVSEQLHTIENELPLRVKLSQAGRTYFLDTP